MDELSRRQRVREVQQGVARAYQRARVQLSISEDLVLRAQHLRAESARQRALRYELRFPDGDFELGITSHPPEVGDLLSRRRQRWRVNYVSPGPAPVAYVERAS